MVLLATSRIGVWIGPKAYSGHCEEDNDLRPSGKMAKYLWSRGYN
jgi:hypothetical protein